MYKKPFHLDRTMVIVLLIGAALALPVLNLIVSSIQYQRSYRHFLYELSVATVYATDNNVLKAQQKDETARVSHKHAYTLFGHFSKDRLKPRSSAPEEPPALILDYGNGATMECWKVRLEETAARKNGVFWRFTAPSAEVWMYDTDQVSIEGLLRPASVSENEPW